MHDCIVLGSGRSGTSMLAGVLAEAGYHTGNQLLPATTSNPKGYFEDREINRINEDLLVQVVKAKPPKAARLFRRRPSYGQMWLAALDPDVCIRAPVELIHRMNSLLECERPFCYKDPRFCYTLDAWRPVFRDVTRLCIFREPGRTAKSMITDSRERPYLRDVKVTRRRALQVWTAMYEHVLHKHRANGVWLFVHYDQIIDGSALTRIETALEASIGNSFIDPILNRSSDVERIPRRTAEVYRQLCDLAEFA